MERLFILEKSRDKISKQDAEYPTVALEVIRITSVMEYHKDHGVATINIPGVYLDTENKENMIMILRGRLEQLMAMVYTKLYQNYVTMDKNGKPLIYVNIIKSWYFLLKNALLFKNNLLNYMEDYGINTNP